MTTLLLNVYGLYLCHFLRFYRFLLNLNLLKFCFYICVTMVYCMMQTGASFQTHVAAGAWPRRATFACWRSVSVPPCLRPIEEEEMTTIDAGDAPTTSISSSSSSSGSFDEMSLGDDQLPDVSDPTLYHGTKAVAQSAAAATLAARRFVDISSTPPSTNNGKQSSQNNDSAVHTRDDVRRQESTSCLIPSALHKTPC